MSDIRDIEPIETANQHNICRASGESVDEANLLLEQIVMNGMADDWEPTGGVSGYLGADGRVTVLQAMVRYRG